MNFVEIADKEPITINGVEVIPDEVFLVENFMVDNEEEDLITDHLDDDDFLDSYLDAHPDFDAAMNGHPDWI